MVNDGGSLRLFESFFDPVASLQMIQDCVLSAGLLLPLGQQCVQSPASLFGLVLLFLHAPMVAHLTEAQKKVRGVFSEVGFS